MNFKSPLILLIILFFSFSCSKDEDIVNETLQNQLETIDYFKEIALGSEFGTGLRVTKKWQSTVKLFLDGTTTPALIDKVRKTINEINRLTTDGLFLEIVEDKSLSNSVVFFGSASGFTENFPDINSDLIERSFGFFSSLALDNVLNKSRIFIDTNRTDSLQQESIILEEITQSLGLANDSDRFRESIFFETSSNSGFVTEFSAIDRELIRLLYHPDMKVGMNENDVDRVLRNIYNIQ